MIDECKWLDKRPNKHFGVVAPGPGKEGVVLEAGLLVVVVFSTSYSPAMAMRRCGGAVMGMFETTI